MRTPDRLYTWFRQPVMPDFAFSNQVAQRADNILDRHGRIDTVLIDEIKVVGSQALEHAFDRNPNMLRAAVEAGQLLSGLWINIETELGLKDDLVPDTLQCLADHPFGEEGTVASAVSISVTPRSTARRMRAIPVARSIKLP